MPKAAPPGVSIGPDGVARCWWGDSDELYRSYHDTEWGRPVSDDRRLFEKLSLEGFMSGLSWLTILRKRENFRAAFHRFDPSAVARFTTRGCRAADARQRHRPQPGQDRGDNQQRQA